MVKTSMKFVNWFVFIVLFLVSSAMLSHPGLQSDYLDLWLPLQRRRLLMRSVHQFQRSAQHPSSFPVSWGKRQLQSGEEANRKEQTSFPCLAVWEAPVEPVEETSPCFCLKMSVWSVFFPVALPIGHNKQQHVHATPCAPSMAPGQTSRRAPYGNRVVLVPIKSGISAFPTGSLKQCG